MNPSRIKIANQLIVAQAPKLKYICIEKYGVKVPPPLPQEQVKRWVEKDRYNFALDVYYVSNLTAQDLLKVRTKYLKSVLGDNSFIQMVVQSTEDQNIQPWTTNHFDKSFTLKADQRSRTMMGNYLRVICAYESDVTCSPICPHS